MASSKECPVWLQEKEVQKVKAEGNLSFPQARQIVVQRNTLPISGLTSATQTRSIASVIKQGLSWFYYHLPSAR